jgi:glycosyltransferase involved in cell wall biosynthesis
MACGRPVIGSRVGGIAHTVSEGRTGFLVPPHDPAALADRLARLHRDRALCQRMGAAARQRARRHYTWAKVGGGLLEAYRKAGAGATPIAASRRVPAAYALASPGE